MQNPDWFRVRDDVVSFANEPLFDIKALVAPSKLPLDCGKAIYFSRPKGSDGLV